MKIKERGIIFNGEMVRAIIDGRKTQTRRILSHRQLKMIDTASSIGECYPLDCGIQHENSQSYYREFCPFGQVGDRLWVRETFCEVYDFEVWTDYRATPEFNESHPAGWDCDPKDPDALKWKSASQMPRRLSCITLEITDIRVERLNDMSENDARSEGCEGGHDSIPRYHYSATPHEHFHNVWTSIYGKDSWQSNPWVWVIEFKRIVE